MRVGVVGRDLAAECGEHGTHRVTRPPPETASNRGKAQGLDACPCSKAMDQVRAEPRSQTWRLAD